MDINPTISLSQLRTDSLKLQAYLAANQSVILQKGTRQIGVIQPVIKTATRKKEKTPLFLRGFNMGGNYKKAFIKRADFYE